jgi:hypothetical protein
MAINNYYIVAIGAYFTNGYWWILMLINGYYICGYSVGAY